MLVAVVAAVVGLVAAVHLGMVFLHVAPPNPVSREYAGVVDGWIRPEFTQNWKLFAPEPLHADVRVEARAIVRGDGDVRVSDWVDVTAPDIAATRHNPLPSHTRNQLRKGWRLYVQTHDADNRPITTTGVLMRSYLQRLALRRLDGVLPAGRVERLQLRSATTPVPEPSWSDRPPAGQTSYRLLPWWDVTG